VPSEALVGQQGQGFKSVLHALDGGRINIAACRWVLVMVGVGGGGAGEGEDSRAGLRIRCVCVCVERGDFPWERLRAGGGVKGISAVRVGFVACRWVDGNEDSQGVCWVANCYAECVQPHFAASAYTASCVSLILYCVLGPTVPHCVMLCCAVLCCRSVGGAAFCVDYAWQYANERKQFGQPVGAFQASQVRLQLCDSLPDQHCSLLLPHKHSSVSTHQHAFGICCCVWHRHSFVERSRSVSVDRTSQAQH
jgi:hypothetical protein